MGNLFKKVKNKIKTISHLLIRKRADFVPLNEEDYLSRFGIEKKDDKYEVTNKDFLTKSYEKAWKIETMKLINSRQELHIFGVLLF